MSKRSINLTEDLYDYLLKSSLRETKVLEELRQETRDLPERGMQISPDQGQFMAFLLRVMAARRVIEVGTFTGYSAAVMAMALPADGRILCCDVSEKYTTIARKHWEQAGVAEKITLKLAPALETLDAEIEAGRSGYYDFCFIDADKKNYDAYYERALVLLRAGGVVAVDNVLWGGSVIDPSDQTEDTVAIRKLNAKIKDDRRVDLSLVPVGDGLTLAMKR